MISWHDLPHSNNINNKINIQGEENTAAKENALKDAAEQDVDNHKARFAYIIIFSIYYVKTTSKKEDTLKPGQYLLVRKKPTDLLRLSSEGMRSDAALSRAKESVLRRNILDRL